MIHVHNINITWFFILKAIYIEISSVSHKKESLLFYSSWNPGKSFDWSPLLWMGNNCKTTEFKYLHSGMILSALETFCWTRIACILLRHRLKSPFPSNLSKSILVLILAIELFQCNQALIPLVKQYNSNIFTIAWFCPLLR